MKKFCISFIIIGIIILSITGINVSNGKSHTEYLRIHIRAHSNQAQEQTVKYQVKDAVVEFLTPLIAQCNTKEKAQKMLNENVENIRKITDGVLKSKGFAYTSKVSVKNELFPTRVYGSLQLDGGYYDALIIELGSASGDNWWCVVYPPLCFTGGASGYVYRSKILDIVNDFFNKEKK